MEKEFFMKLKLYGMEYNALELEQLIWRALLLENPTVPLELGEKNDITVGPIEFYGSALQKIIEIWLQFEKSEIDEIDFSVGVSNILKPLYWEDYKNK